MQRAGCNRAVPAGAPQVVAVVLAGAELRPGDWVTASLLVPPAGLSDYRVTPFAAAAADIRGWHGGGEGQCAGGDVCAAAEGGGRGGLFLPMVSWPLSADPLPARLAVVGSGCGPDGPELFPPLVAEAPDTAWQDGMSAGRLSFAGGRGGAGHVEVWRRLRVSNVT